MSIPFTHRPPRDAHTYGQNPLLGPKIGPLGIHGGIPPVQQRLGPPGGHLHDRHLPPQLGYVSFTDSRAPPRNKSFHSRREAEQKLQACLHSLEASTSTYICTVLHVYVHISTCTYSTSDSYASIKQQIYT